MVILGAFVEDCQNTQHSSTILILNVACDSIDLGHLQLSQEYLLCHCIRVAGNLAQLNLMPTVCKTKSIMFHLDNIQQPNN